MTTAGFLAFGPALADYQWGINVEESYILDAHLSDFTVRTEATLGSRGLGWVHTHAP